MQLFIEIKCERSGNAVAQRRASSRGTCVLPALETITLLPIQTLSSALLRRRQWCPLNPPSLSPCSMAEGLQ